MLWAGPNRPNLPFNSLAPKRVSFFRRSTALQSAAAPSSMDPKPDPPAKELADADVNDLLPIRRLEIYDHSKGFVDLLGQLSSCPPISDAHFRSRFAELASSGDDHVICVVEDPTTGRIVATGSIFVEKKFLRSCGKVGHIEDVVIDATSRGRRLGQRMVRYLADHARAAGCYKVILDCTVELRGFYEKCGFAEKNVQMAMYFRN